MGFHNETGMRGAFSSRTVRRRELCVPQTRVGDGDEVDVTIDAEYNREYRQHELLLTIQETMLRLLKSDREIIQH